MDKNIDIFTTFAVIACSLLATIGAEALNYFLVYRKSDYQNLVSNVKSLAKKIEKMQEVGPNTTNKNNAKRKTQLEERLKLANTELTMKKFKATILVGILMIVTLTSMNKQFYGTVVAKLPFVPFSLISKLSHRGLEGEDYTDCSSLFIYVISGIVFRTNVQKLFGFEAPQVMSPFDQNLKLN